MINIEGAKFDKKLIFVFTVGDNEVRDKMFEELTEIFAKVFRAQKIEKIPFQPFELDAIQ